MASPTTESNNRVAFITGSTGGIGRATALALAKEGCYDLALHYNTASQDVRQELSRAITDATSQGKSIKHHFFQADMAAFDQVRELHLAVVRELGNPSILFNNAGSGCGFSGVQSLADIPIDVFEQSWRVNTGSGILLTQLCLPFMERQGWGRVVWCSSVAAFTGGYVGPHYAGAKSGVHGVVHWLAGNVAKKGVTVNAVAPAMIEGTNMMGNTEDEGMKARISQRLPVGRLGRPEEVADTVMWMVKTGYVTNKVILIDGGYHPY